MIDHVFEVIWNDSTDPDWTFDGKDKFEEIVVCPGDTILFKFFPGLGVEGQLSQAVLLSGTEGGADSASPFTQPFPIILSSDSLLTVVEGDGSWGFCIAFSVSEATGNTRFLFVPDPELQVGSRPKD